MKFIFKKLITIKEKMWQLYSYQIPAVFNLFSCCIEHNSKSAIRISNYLMKFYIILEMTKKVENESGKISLKVLFLKKIMKTLSSIFQ